MIQEFFLRIRRAESPGYRALKKLAQAIISFNLPLPRFALAFYRMLYALHDFCFQAVQWALSVFFREPAFRSRCARAGKRLYVSRLPYIVGHAKIYIGDDVNLFGKVDIVSGASFDEPKLILKDRVELGHDVAFVVNKEIVIEEDVNISSRVQLRDTDSHPRDATQRIAGMRPGADENRAIRVCRYAWVGFDAVILKGVTIGEGAIIGAKSVVVTDVPPYTVVMGNPARTIAKGLKPVNRGPIGTPPQEP